MSLVLLVVSIFFPFVHSNLFISSLPPFNEDFLMFAFLLGMSVMCIFWLMSLDVDIYEKELEEPKK